MAAVEVPVPLVGGQLGPRLGGRDLVQLPPADREVGEEVPRAAMDPLVSESWLPTVEYQGIRSPGLFTERTAAARKPSTRGKPRCLSVSRRAVSGCQKCLMPESWTPS